MAYTLDCIPWQSLPACLLITSYSYTHVALCMQIQNCRLAEGVCGSICTAICVFLLQDVPLVCMYSVYLQPEGAKVTL